MFKRINCSLITVLAVATSADPHIRNLLFTRGPTKPEGLISSEIFSAGAVALGM